MKIATHFPKLNPRSFGVIPLATLLYMGCLTSSPAWPLGRTTFYNNAPFVGTNGVHSLAASQMEDLLTVAAWADTNATVEANLYQWWWILGVDSGLGNGALIDGDESMTLEFSKSVGADMIYFLYTGGYGDGFSNLARINISGFAANPIASAVTYNSPRISNLTYTNGTLTFDYLNDGPGNDYGQLMLADPVASAGTTLKITGAISPSGDANQWYAALYRVDVGEAWAGPRLMPTRVTSNTTNTQVTPDGALTVRGFADVNATIPAKLGRYQDECFGVYGGPGGNVVDTNESLTMQFASGVGLSRLDSVYSYSGGNVMISGFLSDPGFVDPTFGTLAFSYSGGVLTLTIADGGLHAFGFTNRAASAGQTLRVNVANIPGNQFGISAIGYADLHTLLGTDIPSNVSPTYTTADGLLTLVGYADTPGTVPVNIYRNLDWFGVSGGANTESTEGAESLALQFTGGAGLTALGTRYTSGQVIISGFQSDPGFHDPSGIAMAVSYSAGTLSYVFDSPVSPEIVVGFTNLAASANRTLSLHTDGGPGSQVTLTRIQYQAAAAPVTLNIMPSGGNVILTWSTGTLQESIEVQGGYTDVSGASSPYTNSVSGMRKFFRVKVQ